MNKFLGKPYRILDAGSFPHDWYLPIYANSSEVKLIIFEKSSKIFF